MSRKILLALLLLAGCPSRQEILDTAEDKAKLVAEKNARLAKGVGEAMKGEGSKAAEAISEGAGKMLNGAGRGIENGLDSVQIATSAELAETKLKIERAQRHRPSVVPAVKVYAVADAPWKGGLLLVAKDAAGKEVGRSKLDFETAEPTGKYLVFEFDKLVDLELATQYQISSVATPK